MNYENKFFSRFYPAKNSAKFENLARENWLNFQNMKIAGNNSAAVWLFLSLGSKHFKVTVFAAWLILCLKRPWQNMPLNTLNDFIKIKGLHCAFSEKFLNKEVEPLFKKITGCQLPSLQTLRVLMSKRQFQKNALNLPITKDAKLYKLMRVLSQVFRNMKGPFKLFIFIKDEKYVTKSELMRKFGLRKKQCDRWLQRLVDEDLVRIKKYPNRRTFIVYTGPENL